MLTVMFKNSPCLAVLKIQLGTRLNKPRFKVRSEHWQLKSRSSVHIPVTASLSSSSLSSHNTQICLCTYSIALSILAQFKLETKLGWKYSAMKSVTLTQARTHIHHLLKFLLLADSHHTLGVPHHPGNTLAQAKLLGHVSFTDKVSADHKAKSGD